MTTAYTGHAGEGLCLICGKPPSQHDTGLGLLTCRGIAVPTYRAALTPQAPSAPDGLRERDGRHEIVASLIRDAIEIGTDEAADWNAERIMAYLLVEPRGCPTPGACSAALATFTEPPSEVVPEGVRERIIWHVEQVCGPLDTEPCVIPGDDDRSILAHNIDCELATLSTNSSEVVRLRERIKELEWIVSGGPR